MGLDRLTTVVLDIILVVSFDISTYLLHFLQCNSLKLFAQCDSRDLDLVPCSRARIN